MISSDDRSHYEDAINLLVNRISQRGNELSHLDYVVDQILYRSGFEDDRSKAKKYIAAEDPAIRDALQRAVNNGR